MSGKLAQMHVPNGYDAVNTFSICNVIFMRMISPFVKNAPFGPGISSFFSGVQNNEEEYREFSSSGVQLVFWVVHCPIAAMLSFEHICTEMTTLLAKSFLVSM